MCVNLQNGSEVAELRFPPLQLEVKGRDFQKQPEAPWPQGQRVPWVAELGGPAGHPHGFPSLPEAGLARREERLRVAA